jgi:hypothetical protein
MFAGTRGGILAHGLKNASRLPPVLPCEIEESLDCLLRPGMAGISH